MTCTNGMLVAPSNHILSCFSVNPCISPLHITENSGLPQQSRLLYVGGETKMRTEVIALPQLEGYKDPLRKAKREIHSNTRRVYSTSPVRRKGRCNPKWEVCASREYGNIVTLQAFLQRRSDNIARREGNIVLRKEITRFKKV
ncbi:2111_t:CDS:1 [Funneliformis caledonium]|uniref:2111_t:CDS:1 n=1 Tax=Funneliformis caledonium TaxID=1117310 RepID=A0A9N9GH68_9GLOM|nr:2111_t:CDS:1 [Funneliformis caledonium]